MKLLIVAHYFPLRGPIAFKVHDLIHLLPPLGVDVSVISQANVHQVFHSGRAESIGNARIYRALTLDLRLAELIIDVFQVVSTFLLSLVVILREKADFVFISVPPGAPGIGTFFAGKALHKRIVIDVRDRWEDYAIRSSKFGLARLTNRVLKELYDVFLRSADLVDGVTLSLVKYLKSRGASKVIYLPNGADVTLFHPVEDEKRRELRSKLGLSDKNLALVYAGGIGAYYRPDFVIQSLHDMLNDDASPEIKFLIVGGAGTMPEEQLKMRELLSLVKDLHFEDRVIFFGEQERTYVASLLPLCDVGVVPYDDNPLWKYPQPTKFFEYCASGLPVIATIAEDSDLAMLIRRYKIGYAVRPLNANEFISAMREYCGLNKKEQEEMGERARNLVEDSFDKMKTAQKLVNALKELKHD